MNYNTASDNVMLKIKRRPPCEKGGLCLGYKSRILVSLRMFDDETSPFLVVKVSFMVHSKV